MKFQFFIIAAFLISRSTAANETFCNTKRQIYSDIQSHTTCPSTLLNGIYEFYKNCPHGNTSLTYDPKSLMSKEAMFWAGQKKLELKYGEADYGQLGMGAFRPTEYLRRFQNLTVGTVVDTVHKFPNYASSPYTQFTAEEYAKVSEIGIGCWAEENTYKDKKGMSVWVWIYTDLPKEFRKRIKLPDPTTTTKPKTTVSTTKPPTTAPPSPTTAPPPPTTAP